MLEYLLACSVMRETVAKPYIRSSRVFWFFYRQFLESLEQRYRMRPLHRRTMTIRQKNRILGEHYRHGNTVLVLDSLFSKDFYGAFTVKRAVIGSGLIWRICPSRILAFTRRNTKRTGRSHKSLLTMH